MARKPYLFNGLVIATMLLSCLWVSAPIAGAAPQVIDKVTIDDVQVAGASVNPAYVTSNTTGNNTFMVVYSVSGTAGDPAKATFWLGTKQLGQEDITLPVSGRGMQLMVPNGQPEGTYNLQVVVETFADLEAGAVWAGSLIVDNTPPLVPGDVMIAPKAGDQWEIGGQEHTPGGRCNMGNHGWFIQWTRNVILDAHLKGVNLYYSPDNGATWPVRINTTLVPGDAGMFEWCAYAPQSDTAKIKLEALDQSGNVTMATSAVFTLWGVSHWPPAVEIVAPEDNAMISGKAYGVQAEAWTPAPDGQGIAEVRFFYSADLGKTWLDIGKTDKPGGAGPHGHPLYGVPWDTTKLANGSKVWVKAVAVTNADAPGEDVHFGIVVDNTPVVVTILKPAANAILPATFTIEAHVDFGDIGLAGDPLFYFKTASMTGWEQITCSAPAQRQLLPAKSSESSCTWTPTLAQLPEGAVFSIQVKATSNSGVVGTAQVDNLKIDRLSPVVPAPWLMFPTHGVKFQTGSTLTIQWKTGCHDPNLASNPISLYYFDNNWHMQVPIAERIADTGSFDWKVAGVPSEFAQILIVCLDQAGNKSKQESATFAIWSQDQTPPVVALTDPAADGTKLTTPFVLKATASDPQSGIQDVTFWFANYDEATGNCGVGPDPEDWWRFVGVDLNAPYEMTWNVPSGLYCVKAMAYNGNWWPAFDIKKNVMVDNQAPYVEWEIPEESRTWVNGTQLLEVEAEALSGIKSVAFSYSADSCEDPNAVSLGIATQAPWSATWDTTTLADGRYWIKVLATSMVGHTTINCRWFKVDNSFAFSDDNENDLQTGWNLISLPRIPFDTKIANVMKDVSGVQMVTTFVWENDKLVQKSWTPGGPVGTLKEMTSGQGYWIEMNNNSDLINHGWYNPPAPQVPPSYDVHAGWNLIGMHTTYPGYMKTVSQYLGAECTASAKAVYYYSNGVYYPVGKNDPMVPGLGYWLAVNAAGTIFP